MVVFILQMPRSVFEEMKYLEIMIVSDHSMVCVLTQSSNNNRSSAFTVFNQFILVYW